MQPFYDPNYLKRLKSNPMFRDLQSLLLQECLQMQVPASLITTSWNLMHVPKTTATAPPGVKGVAGSGQEVYMQHMKLQDKLLKVRIDPAISADGLSVENHYSTEVGQIEMGRYRALHSCSDEKVKVTMNSYYDKERLHLIKNTESKLDALMEKADKIRRDVQKTNRDTTLPSRQGTQPTQGASLLLQPIDESKLSAVRQLKFNTSDEKDSNDADDDEDNDYLNGSVNSEDFEIDEIDVETVDSVDKDNITTNRNCSMTESSETALNLSVVNDDLTEKDLLQQCITASGIRPTPAKLKDIYTEIRNEKENGGNILPDSSTIDSPDSLTEKDSFYSTSDSDSINDNFSAAKLQTPQPTYGLKFTQPRNINVALTEIEKLCRGPTVSFTPELRRDITVSFTPDSQKYSPLTEICASTAVNLDNSSQGQTQISRKRKSCDEVVIDIPEETNVVNQQADSLSDTYNNCADYQTPVLKTHRMLNSETTNILTNWYQAHVQYPYPSDEEVEHLAKLTNITTRQVKKWMANKRVRCFNTLSITGNQHPIKYKYQATGRRRRANKAGETNNSGKENCDSTTIDNKPVYSLLNEESRIILTQWFDSHLDNPYPSEEEKHHLAAQCGISVNQVKSWFANKRNRTNNTRKQVPNYFLNKFPEYTHMVNFVGQKREEARVSKRRKVNECMYIQPTFYL